MVQKRTRNGQLIDFDAMLAAGQKERAIGNMDVNAKGDVVKAGEVVKTNEDRVRERCQGNAAIIATAKQGFYDGRAAYYARHETLVSALTALQQTQSDKTVTQSLLSSMNTVQTNVDICHGGMYVAEAP